MKLEKGANMPISGDGIKCVSLHQRSHNSSECDSNAHFTNGVCKCNFGFSEMASVAFLILWIVCTIPESVIWMLLARRIQEAASAMKASFQNLVLFEEKTKLTVLRRKV